MSSPADPTPVHAPAPTVAQRWLGKLHVTGVFWYWFHHRGVAFLPSWGVGVFITIFTSFFFCFLFTIRRAIAANLEPVLGPAGFLRRQLRIWRTMWTFAWCLSERYERLGTDRAFEIRVVNQEAWRRVAASGEGFVMVSAHVGNYEVGSMLPSSEEQRHVHLVREREANPAAQRYVEGLLAGLDDAESYSWHFEGDEPFHGLPLLQALRRGEIVAVHGDRPRTGAKTYPAQLFGRPFELPAGPPTLARAAEVQILPVFMLREGRRRYRAVMREPFRVARTADRDRDVAEAVRRIAAEVEWAIRQEPHQWFCFRKIWE